MTQSVVTTAIAPKTAPEDAARHARVENLHVLRLAGDFYEMGRQHGALLRDEVRDGPVPYYTRMVERLTGKSFGRAAPLLTSLVQRSVGARVAKALPDFARETIHGIADGAGLDRAEFLRGCTMPDALVWVVARMAELQGHGPAVAHRLRLGLGCTSAVAWGKATTDGKLYHARNFDYHGVGNWPKNSTVSFFTPAQGQRYAAFGAAGVGLGGITAMNEAGLSLTVHQHMFTKEAKLGGTPIGTVGDAVMREARDLDDAERILRSYTSIGCWTYVVTDGRTKEVLCFEENPRLKAPRRIPTSAGTFGYANVYLDPVLGETEVASYGSYWRHNEGRHARVNALLVERAGSLDAAGMAGILADTGTASCRVRDSIAMVMTVGSVVFRPEDGVFWIGTGEAPTSRGLFVPFSIAKQGHAPEHGDLRTETDGVADLAFEEYRKAYVAYLDEGDVRGAREHIARAAALEPKQAIYHAVVGLLSIELGEAEAARRAFDAAIALGHTDEERVASFHLWRARAYDLAGERAAATRDYRAAIGRRADPPVHAAAASGLRRAFTPRAAKRVQVEMSLGDVVRP